MRRKFDLRAFVLGISIIIGSIYFGSSYLDHVFNHRINPHAEIMLWHYTGYPKDKSISFSDSQISTAKDKLKVIYRIKNISDKTVNLHGWIDITLVRADGDKIGDPGTNAWVWSKEVFMNAGATLKPGDVYAKEVEIDRTKLKFEDTQYYINLLFQGEIVAQYKIIEGIGTK